MLDRAMAVSIRRFRRFFILFVLFILGSAADGQALGSDYSSIISPQFLKEQTFEAVLQDGAVIGFRTTSLYRNTIYDARIERKVTAKGWERVESQSIRMTKLDDGSVRNEAFFISRDGFSKYAVKDDRSLTYRIVVDIGEKKLLQEKFGSTYIIMRPGPDLALDFNRAYQANYVVKGEIDPLEEANQSFYRGNAAGSFIAIKLDPPKIKNPVISGAPLSGKTRLDDFEEGARQRFAQTGDIMLLLAEYSHIEESPAMTIWEKDISRGTAIGKCISLVKILACEGIQAKLLVGFSALPGGMALDFRVSYRSGTAWTTVKMPSPRDPQVTDDLRFIALLEYGLDELMNFDLGAIVAKLQTIEASIIPESLVMRDVSTERLESKVLESDLLTNDVYKNRDLGIEFDIPDGFALSAHDMDYRGMEEGALVLRRGGHEYRMVTSKIKKDFTDSDLASFPFLKERTENVKDFVRQNYSKDGATWIYRRSTGKVKESDEYVCISWLYCQHDGLLTQFYVLYKEDDKVAAESGMDLILNNVKILPK